VNAASTAGAGDALLAGVLIGLAGGLPAVGDGPDRTSFSERPLDTALDLGTLLAGFSVTSPHTIHPEADRRALSAFAESLGASMSPEMADLLSWPAPTCNGSAQDT
jgi:sugar/nucleoside kinase (ribokinase family)